VTNDKNVGTRSEWLWGKNDHEKGVSLTECLNISQHDESKFNTVFMFDQGRHVHLCFSKNDSARLRRSDQALCCSRFEASSPSKQS
jgi:hypothetical protein